MKRLNKITLILVAVMGMAINGCGGDIKKAPYVRYIDISEDNISAMFASPCYNEKFYKTDEAISKCTDDIWEKMKNDLNVISLKGRRDCGKLPVKVEDCPPKDRKSMSYTLKLKTKFGTFKYNIGDESTYTEYGYLPIK